MPAGDDDLAARATELRQRALDDASDVDLGALASIIGDPAAPPDAHGPALVALMTVAREREDLAESLDGSFADLVEDVATLADRPSLDAAFPLRCLRAIASSHPEVVLPHADAVAAHVTVDESDVTKAATGCAVELAGAEPVAVLDLTPTVASLLDAEDPTIRRNAAYVLAQVAGEFPEAAKPAAPQLVDGLADRHAAFRTSALSALGAIASKYPAVASDAVDVVATVAAEASPDDGSGGEPGVDADEAGDESRADAGGARSSRPSAANPDDSVEDDGSASNDATAAGDVDASSPSANTGRTSTGEDGALYGNAVALLADVARADPSAVAAHVDALLDGLDAEQAVVRGNAAAGIVHLAVADEAAADDAVPGLVELLDDPSPIVRRNACKALAHLEATVALEQLRSMSDDDPDDRVAAVAAWAVEQVS